MSETTNIAWADSTFNPWIGCTQVGPGCDGCYAEALMDRRMGRVKWGAGEKRQRTSEAYWRQPLAWDRKARESGQPWRVFCASLADVFDNEVPASWREDLFEVIRATPALTWMLLTKRVGNVEDMLPGGWYARSTYPNGPWPNVWLGATVVNQEEADRDIPKLLRVPAAVRFLSIEPMLGPIDLAAIPRIDPEHPHPHQYELSDIDWVIVGGESDQPGHRARPFNIAWARDIVRQCKAAQVPVFVKQLGSAVSVRNDSIDEWPDEDAFSDAIPEDYHPAYQGEHVSIRLHDRSGADPSEWPADLRVREFPR